jgi:Peptidase family M54
MICTSRFLLLFLGKRSCVDVAPSSLVIGWARNIAVLPRVSELFHKRLLKESVHEIGHTLLLSHCEDYGCAMSPSHGVEWIGLKSRRFCRKGGTSVPSGAAITANKAARIEEKAKR